jgi:coenzyme F420-reducing hydrogenase beta subunit
MRSSGKSPSPSASLNVTLNKRRQITGVWAGAMLAEHGMAVVFVRRTAMHAISEDMRDEAKRKHDEKHRVDRTVRQGDAKQRTRLFDHHAEIDAYKAYKEHV